MQAQNYLKELFPEVISPGSEIPKQGVIMTDIPEDIKLDEKLKEDISRAQKI